MSTDSLKDREIYIEFQSLGTLVKVNAMDTMTMTEISIQGPRSAGETALKLAALRRLEYVLRKKGVLT